MTKREAAIVYAYTGILVGEFDELHGYIEEIMGRPVWTHELGSLGMEQELKNRSRNDFLKIEVTDEIFFNSGF